MRKIGIKDLSLFFGYALLFYIARELSVTHWLLSNGLRFATLLFLPLEWWPVILAADVLGSMSYRVDHLHRYGLPWFVVSTLLPSLAATAPAYWLRRSKWLSEDCSLSKMASLLVKGATAYAVICALLSTTAMQLIHYSAADPAPTEGPIYFFSIFTLGNYLGVLMLVPAVLTWHLLQRREYHRVIRLVPGSSREISTTIFTAIGAIAALLVFNRMTSDVDAQRITGILMFVPAVWVTFKRGWIGAIPVSIAANLALQLTMRQVGPQDVDSKDLLEAQALMALVASAMLVLGASITELKLRACYLSDESGRHLELARRNLMWGETHVRRGAEALETAFNALQANPSVAVAAAAVGGGYPVTARANAVARWNIEAGSRNDVQKIIDALKLDSVETNGIRLALAFGPCGQQLNAAGVKYSVKVSDGAYTLPQDIQVRLYRFNYDLVTLLAAQYTPHKIAVKVRVFGTTKRSVSLTIKVWPGNTAAAELPSPCVTLADLRDVAKSFNGLMHDHRYLDQPTVSVMLGHF